ncbi:hypothetical protein DFH08DRAFT_902915 [Mycena albidolilacea]|uniref:Uncharacterized protein n=1 Tax=Mycena albidolilacea TaxID=1033008 RepID=A0AAD6Z2X9_9AGAR|nr:hypothetical protein DFH08DRAFT_902915 [Mycena albidolilacea]
MTEYDSSPAAYHQFRRTQQRISNWADDTAQCAPQYKSPFIPRSDVQNNAFYNPSPSSSRSPTRRTSQGTSSRGYPSPQPGARAPRRGHTIAVDVVSPHDSISQVSGPSHRSGSGHRSRRTQSHSPHRHSSSTSRHRSHHRSPTTAYVTAPIPQYGGGGVQYVQAPYGQVVQYQVPQQQQPAAYVVNPRDGKVQVVYAQPAVQYPPVAQPTQEHHGGLLQRIFGSQSGKHGRSRSVSVPRSRR